MNEEVFEDAFNFLCLDSIGGGIHRKVFTCRIRDDVVVKVEDNGAAAMRSFANVREFDCWHYWSDYSKVADWLAPCRFLSPDGRLMLQDRVDPLPADYPMPEKLPSFLTDHKRGNFGLLKGRFVCVDYAVTILAANTRLRKVTW